MNTNFHYSGMTIFFCLVVYTTATFNEVVPSATPTPSGSGPLGVLRERWMPTSGQVTPDTGGEELQPAPAAH